MSRRSLLRRAALASLLLPVLLLGGCLGNFTQKDDEKSLQATLRAYEGTVRWGRLEDLYGFLDQEMAKDTLVPRGLENIQVTGYEVLRPAAKVGEDQAEQTVRIEYVHVDEQVQRRITDRQLWKYYKEKNRWTRYNLIPAFR